MEKIKKLPQRKCVGCGEHRDKCDLWRIVKSPSGDVSLDKTGKAQGRGAYICRSVACLKKAIKAHRLESNLEASVPSEVYEALENAMIEETK